MSLCKYRSSAHLRKLAKNIDTDKKSFYAYVRSRSRTRPAVNTLVNSQGVTTVQPNDLAEEFNKYFASVFTLENMDKLPDAGDIFAGSGKDKLTHIQAGRRLDSAPVSDVVALATKVGPAGRLRW